MTSRTRRDPSLSASSIDAAALQNEMAKQLGLKISNAPKKRLPKSDKSVNSSQSRTCPSCDSTIPNEINQEYCTVCGYGNSSQQRNANESSLALRRGLVPMPPKPSIDVMKPFDWYFIEKQLHHKADPDTCCPICMEKFDRGDEVLLSCGHIFHKVCLRSFENFVKNVDLSCPICRTKNYQKKLTNLGKLSLEKVSATRIQTIARGFLARTQYKRMLRRLYRNKGGNEALRTKFLQKECAVVTKRMDKTMEDHAHKVDNMLRSMDRTIEDSRQLDILFEQMLLQRQACQISDSVVLPPSPVQERPPFSTSSDLFSAFELCLTSGTSWGEILHQAKSRGTNDCAICMSSVPTEPIPSLHKKKSVLLSCSHLFHHNCIVSFEKFGLQAQRKCPVCRSEYERRVLM